MQRLSIAFVLACGVSLAHAATFANRRVSDVLSELRAAGYVFIYSTDTIPSQLLVTSEPRATGGLDLAREVLAPHGLVLVEAAPKVFSVVRGVPSQPVEEQPRTNTPAVEEMVVQTSRYTLSN